MLRTARSPVDISFSRSGGSIIVSRTDIWKAKDDGWELVDNADFNDPRMQSQTASLKLAPGTYTCVFQCFVEESVNGIYAFSLDIAGKPTMADKGDANTTPAKSDTKVFKDQFVLVVEGKKK